MDMRVLLVKDPIRSQELNDKLVRTLKSKGLKVIVVNSTFNGDIFKNLISLLSSAETSISEADTLVGIGYAASIALKLSLQYRMKCLVLIGYKSIMLSLLFDQDFRKMIKVERGDVLPLLEEHEKELTLLEPLFFLRRCPLARKILFIRLRKAGRITELESDYLISLFMRYCRYIKPKIADLDLSSIHKISELI